VSDDLRDALDLLREAGDGERWPSWDARVRALLERDKRDAALDEPADLSDHGGWYCEEVARIRLRRYVRVLLGRLGVDAVRDVRDGDVLVIRAHERD